MMKKPEKKNKWNAPQNFCVADGSQISFEEEDYTADDYVNFLSNGMADNEKIDAVDYFEEFLTETADDDTK